MADNNLIELLDMRVHLPASNGKDPIGKAKKVYPTMISPNFKKWGLNKKGMPSESKVVTGADVVQEGTFRQISVSVDRDLPDACLTQSNIIDFCKGSPKDLNTIGFPTMFLFQVNGTYYVAYIIRYLKGISAVPYLLDDAKVLRINNGPPRKIIFPIV